MATRSNIDPPYTIEIKSINVFNFDRSHQVNIMPQFVEMNIYQSVFQPILRATMLINDNVGFLSRFPFLGEETVEITYVPTRDSDTNNSGGGADGASASTTSVWKFMINQISPGQPDTKGRAVSYIIEMYSIEMRDNLKLRLQRAYYDNYHNVIKGILQNDLKVDPIKLNVPFDNTRGTFHFIIPNLHPVSAITWMTKRSVPEDTTASLFMFWEDFRGYHFKTYKKLLEEGEEYFSASTPALGDYYDRKTYAFLSDDTEQMRQWASQNMKIRESNFITSLQMNERWNTKEKIMGGYFENEFFDIDYLYKRVFSTKVELEPIIDGAITEYNMNTEQFIQAMKTQNSFEGSKTRVRYVLSQSEGDQPEEPRWWKDKFGDGAKHLTALSQVSATAVVSGDTRMNVGDLLTVYIPELSGFNDLNKDYYTSDVQSRFFVSEVKHTISLGGRYYMTMKLHKDSYDRRPVPEYRYEEGN